MATDEDAFGYLIKTMAKFAAGSHGQQALKEAGILTIYEFHSMLDDDFSNLCYIDHTAPGRKIVTKLVVLGDYRRLQQLQRFVKMRLWANPVISNAEWKLVSNKEFNDF